MARTLRHSDNFFFKLAIASGLAHDEKISKNTLSMRAKAPTPTYQPCIKGRLYQEKAELVQKQILPRAAYEGITYNVVAKQKCGRAAPQPPSEPVATDEEQEAQRKNECQPGTS